VSQIIAVFLHSSRNPRSVRSLREALLLGVWFVLLAFVRADYRDEIGYNKLALELGGALPTGNGVGVSQIEAPENYPNTPYNFLPNTSLAEFSGKTFTVLSPAGGVSGHA